MAKIYRNLEDGDHPICSSSAVPPTPLPMLLWLRRRAEEWKEDGKVEGRKRNGRRKRERKETDDSDQVEQKIRHKRVKGKKGR